ncbi:MAG: AMP-binding protein [Deltaproteobacteria bacterium]|nr:AMP-binding protein [Deltaproteobacteria bacterium]
MSKRATGSFVMGNYPKVAAARYGDREAIYCVTTGKRLSFRELNERINGLGNGLMSLGVKKGDVTAFLSHNRVEIVETYGGLAKIGSLGIPLNYRLSSGEIVELVNFCDAENFIFDPTFSDQVAGMRAQMPKIKRFICMGDDVPDFADSYESIIAGASHEEPDVDISEEDYQYLNLTSGTTGLPKAYLLTHYNNAVAGPVMASMHDVTSDDVILTVFPIFGRVGFAWFGIGLYTGARNVILQFDLVKMLEVIEQEKVTIANWVPTLASFVLSIPDLEKYDLSSLRALVFAAAPLPKSLQDQVKERICPSMYEFYGLQETGILVNMGPRLKELKPESVGTLYYGADVRIIDPATGQDVAPGEVGEIIGRGVAVTTGYYKNEEKTKEAFKDGWFHTGDLGRFDEDGFLYLSGRMKDMLISGGQNVFAVEVEDMLMTHEAVAQCAVIGLPDDTWGEMVTAVIVKFPGREVTEEEIIAYSRERIAHFKAPKKVFFVDGLPMTPTGKVTKYVLVEQFSEKK